MKKRDYVLPYSAADGGLENLDALLNGMGAETDGDAPEEDTAEEDTNTEDTAEEQQQQQQKPTAQHQDKQAYAFAEMRNQVNTYKNILSKIATANGIEYGDDKELLSKLSDDTITKLAQKQNVPVELLKKVEALEQDSEALKQTRLKDAALIGFQKVMTDYQLTEQELTKFAQELDEHNLNPFVSEVDLEKEYRNLHFNDIVQKRVDAAVQAALSKSTQADKHSSKPNTKTGGGNNTNQKIDTVSGLNSLLADMK